MRLNSSSRSPAGTLVRETSRKAAYRVSVVRKDGDASEGDTEEGGVSGEDLGCDVGM
ncbi:hypothetical protein BC938DRAFT_475829, partial [Jimgerdemannia flammicorona]